MDSFCVSHPAKPKLSVQRPLLSKALAPKFLNISPCWSNQECGKYWFTSLCVPTCHPGNVLKMRISGPTLEILFTRSSEGPRNPHFMEIHPTTPEMTPKRQMTLTSLRRALDSDVTTLLLPQGFAWQGAEGEGRAESSG